jgi:tetratricopeptide (TPR) repeat protein
MFGWRATPPTFMKRGVFSMKRDASSIAPFPSTRTTRAYAMLSQTHLAAWIQPLDEDHLKPAALERAHCFARKSLQLGPDLSIAYAQLGRVLTFEGQYEQAIAEFEKAVTLNPSFTD